MVKGSPIRLVSPLGDGHECVMYERERRAETFRDDLSALLWKTHDPLCKIDAVVCAGYLAAGVVMLAHLGCFDDGAMDARGPEARRLLLAVVDTIVANIFDAPLANRAG